MKRTRLGWLLLFLLLLPLSFPARAQQLNAQIQVAINQLTTGLTPFTRLRIGMNDYINWGSLSDSTGYGIRDNAGTIEVKNSGGDWTVITGGGGNPIDASYITRIPESSLTNETPLSAIATAILVNTTGTGVPVAYGGTACTNQFIRSLDVTGTATCATVVLSTDTSGTLGATRGGTGLASGTSGGLLAFTGTTTIASSALLADNVLMVGGGAGAAPNTLAAGLGTTTTLMHGNAAGEPTWAAVSLTADVSGITPVANGGTGTAFFAIAGPATSAKTYTFPNVSTSVLTTNTAVTAPQGGTGQTSFAVGDLLYADTTTTLSKLADIATGNVLLSGGVSTAPAWGKVSLTGAVVGTLGPTFGGTGLASYTTGDITYASSSTSLAALPDVATGAVLVSGGVATAPAYSASPTLTAVTAATITSSAAIRLVALADSHTAPTIGSGFGTSPSVVASNGTAAFTINVGTGGSASAGVVSMPTATTGWACEVSDRTASAANTADKHTVQTATTTTTVTVQNQTISSGAAAGWAASAVLQLMCRGY